MEKNSLLFLDFDGVICNSVSETIVSSWLAYYKYINKQIPTAMLCNYKKRFYALRPFIRLGEDYILMQDILFHNISVNNQKEFDQLLQKAGSVTMSYYKEIFYKARTQLLKADRDFWLSLNTIYPHIHSALKSIKAKERVYILSTKKADFIREILSEYKIYFDEQKVIYSGVKNKLAIIANILDNTDFQEAIFIDDQISHLLKNSDSRIKVFLASWGYVKPEWLKGQNQVKVLELEEANKLIKCF